MIHGADCGARASPTGDGLSLPVTALEVGEGGVAKLVIKRLVSYHLFEFPRSATTNWQKPGGLTQQNHILSQLWRLQVQNQGVGKAPASRGQSVPPLSYPVVLLETLGIPSHVDASLQSLPLWSRGILPMSLSLLLRTLVRLGPTLMISS